MRLLAVILIAYLPLQISAATTSSQIKRALESGLQNNAYKSAEVLVFKLDGQRLASARVGQQRDGENNIYDLASISKIFTAAVVMKLIENKKLSLTTKLKKFFPYLKKEKANITIEDLLRHRAGLIPSYKKRDLSIDTPEEVSKRILRYKLWATPKSKFLYSDAGLTLLAQIIEIVEKRSLKDILEKDLFPRTRMTNSFVSYVPKGSNLIVSHEESQSLRNSHDPRGRASLKAPGHAGIFSTSQDLSKFILSFFQKDQRYLSKKVVNQMITGKVRGLGFDLNSVYSNSLKAGCLSSFSISHTGYTGTSFIVDLKKRVAIILLSNRTMSSLDTNSSIRELNKVRRAVSRVVCKL